jgi:hypothetical protein
VSFNAILLLICYLAALAAAYRLASRLAPGALLHTVALTGVGFAANLILPATYAGFVGQLNLPGLALAGIILWGAEFWLASRIHPLADVMFAPERPPARVLRIVFVAAWITIGIMGLLLIVQAIVGITPVVNVDAAWQYFPNMINMVQSGTLLEYNGLTSYFPMAYEILFAWEMVFLRSFVHTPVFHSLFFILSLVYAVLILSFLLRSQRARWRDGAVTVGLILLMSTKIMLLMRQETGKNDLFILVCGLASAYYLLLYWHLKRDTRYLVLIGLVCGLYVTAKMTGLSWVGMIGLVHLALLLKSTGRKPSIRALGQHALAAGIPFVIVSLPWAVRLLLRPDIIRNNQVVTDVARFHSAINQLFNGFFYGPSYDWLLYWLMILAGLALVILPRARMLHILGTLLLVVGLWLQASSIEFETNFGALFTAILAAILLIVRWPRRIDSLPDALAPLLWIVLGTMILLMFIPFSAWSDFFEWEGLYFVTVNYRYSPASYALFLIIIVIALAARWSPKAAAVPQPAQASERHHPSRPYSPLGYVLAVVVIGAFALQTAVGAMRAVQMHYANWEDNFAEDTAFFDWLNSQPGGARIYAINMPPMTLYGPGLTHTVYYAIDQFDGYFGNQAYRWEDVEPLVERLSLDYVIISFSYLQVPQSRILPEADVLAEIERMRAAWDIAYQDEQVTVFRVSRTG